MAEPRILVVGDVMEDHYIHVVTTRQAPEADIPVWDEVSRNWVPGGAWNVAENIKAMMPEAMVYLAGITDGWVADPKIDTESYVVRGVEGMKKTRYVLNKRIIFRHDNFKKFHSDDVSELTNKLFRNLVVPEMRFDAVVFSDYDKGTITKDIINFCRPRSNLVIVDSKRKDPEIFCKDMQDRLTILKLNHQEWGDQQGKAIPIEAYFDFVAVTKGRDGAALRQFDRNESSLGRNIIHEEHFPTKKTWAVDVTGCGDTHTAAMTVALVRERDVRGAVRFANEKASQAVQVFGTAIVT